MKDFRDRVAVVTGAASGIGRALADRFAAEGMKVVLADVEEKALRLAEAEFREKGVDVLGVQTDVSKPDEIEKLAQETLDAFGAVHIVCNNAGVAGAWGQAWANTLDDWNWIIGVNLWGVIHGVRTFLPIMLEQGDEGHIVNTASLAGLMPGRGIYGVTKQAVVALSESIYNDLKVADAKIGVSVLCPGWVNTNIIDAGRNRPAELARTVDAIPDAAARATGNDGPQFPQDRPAAFRGCRPGVRCDPGRQALHHHAPRDGLPHQRALRQHPLAHNPTRAHIGIDPPSRFRSSPDTYHPTHTPARIDPTMEPRIQYAKTSDGVNIAYWSLGEGDPFVHMPWFRMSHVQLEWQIPEIRRWYEALSDRTQLVRYDARGIGLSQRDVTDHSVDALVRDVEAVVDRLEIERFALFGLVHTGPVAITYAARHPERVSKLVLWCTYARSEDYSQSSEIQATRDVIDKNWEMYTNTLAHVRLGWSEGEPARRFAAVMRESMSPEALHASIDAFRDLDVTDLCRR